MPWDASDAKRKTKTASTLKLRSQWKEIANSMLARGKSEGAAIRAANGVIRKRAR